MREVAIKEFGWDETVFELGKLLNGVIELLDSRHVAW